MRQFWVSLAILLTMVAALFGNGWYLKTCIQPMQADLARAAEAAKIENWELAEALSAQVQHTWQEKTAFFQMVQSHRDVGEISCYLEQANEYLACQKLGEYMAAVIWAEGAMEGICHMESIRVGNLL